MTSLRHNAEPRDVYLDAARDCILDVGWRRTTLTEVARRAGVSRMTIYRTWADMPQLLGDLMTREWAGVVADSLAEEDRDAPTIERLVGDIVGTVQRLRENELFVRIVDLDPELILPYLFSRRGRSQDGILELTVAALREAQAEGAARAGNPAGCRCSPWTPTTSRSGPPGGPRRWCTAACATSPRGRSASRTRAPSSAGSSWRSPRRT